MKTGTFPKRIFKKKTNLILAVAILFVLGAGAFALSVRARNTRAKDAGETIIQSTTVTKGSISNTIDASGNLEVSETIDVTVPTGIKVDEITVESGDEVTKGQTLAKLNKTSVTRLLVEVKDSLESIEDELDDSSLSSLEKEQLNGEKAELEETEEQLTALYKKPVITASTSGIIGAVNISENSETSNNAASSDSGSSAGQNNNSGSQMSAESTSGDSPALLFLTADMSADTSDDTKDNPDHAEDKSDDTEDSPSHAEDKSDESSQLKTVTDYSKLSVQAPATGEAPQKTIQETDMYTGTISWNLSGNVFQGGTVYTATIVLTAKKGYTFSEKNLPIIKDASFNWNIYHSGEGNILKITAKYEKTSDTQNGQDNAPDQSDSSSNSGNSKTDGSSAGMAGPKSSGSSAGMSGSKSSGSSGNISGSASSNGTASDSSSEYSAYETVAFTIASQDSVKIIVNVDELDILSVEEEQSAAVTLDALENESYTGTVTKISNTASAGSGSTKYEVEITVPMDENMRIGMSASAAIQVSSAEDTLVLPMTALQQRGGETFVYTQKDEDGNLSGETTVETGLSDGQNVEISSGLTEGDEVFYTRTAADKSESFNEGFGFPGGMGGGGEMPDTPPGDNMRRQDSDGSHDNRIRDGKPSGN